MQLIVILLATVSILTFLSGVIVFFGASKGDKVRSLWFFLAAIFAAFWMTSIATFMIAKPGDASSIGWHVNWTFASAIFIDVAFLGYTAWKDKYGKPLTFFFLLFGLIVSAFILLQPHLLYKDVILSNTGNSVVMNIGPLYFAYIIFFSLIVPAIVMTFLKQYFKSSSKRKKGSDIVIAISFGTSSLLILVFNLIFPLFNRWDFIWIGPLALSATIIAFYYTILRYRSLNLSSIWLKIFSYIVIIASIAIVYMIIFALIFAALFRGSTPSTEVIILNFIMVVIFICLMPALNQLSVSIRSLISGQKPSKKDETDGK
ncbi:hypothetical protein IKG33_00855 [Candidatus Saccharibacteria bacterium]|nr:hypothetical protein [Candidatus Saccharibacteria bacterium]